MKRIGVYLAGRPDQGGVFQYNRSLLEGMRSLADRGYTTVAASSSPEWLDYLAGTGVEVAPLRWGAWSRALAGLWFRAGLPVGAWRNLSKWVHPFTRDLVGAGCDLWIFPSQDYWTYRMPVPALGVVHDLMHRYERRFPEVSQDGEFERREDVYSRICHWSRGVLVDSEVGKTQLMESYGLAPERVHVLPYVAPGYVQEAPPSEDLSAKYGLPERFFFYPAQFWAHKNHGAIVRAVAQLADELPDLAFVFAGGARGGAMGGDLRCQDLIAEHGLQERFHFLGYVPNADVVGLYGLARALVMPTFFGPTNIPPLEAFALGCPVAVSRIYGMPDQVGDAGLFFDPEDPEELAGVLRRLWTDDALCGKLAERGLARSLGWGPTQFSQRLGEILDGVLGEPQPPVLSAAGRGSQP